MMLQIILSNTGIFLHDLDENPLMKLPVDGSALGLTAILPEQVVSIANSFSWTEEGRERARDEFEHSPST